METFSNQASATRSEFGLRRLSAFLGAEITGLDLSRPLPAGVVDDLKRQHAEHGVLVFPNQDLTSDQFMNFGRHFGELTVHPFSSSTKERPELIIFDHKENNPPARTDIWHTDETFKETPPMGTMLYCRIVPEIGGDTVFANMNAIYEGLSPKMQNFLAGLEAVHDFKPFKALFSKTEQGRTRLHQYEEIYPPVTHPVICLHPITKKKILFVNKLFTLFIKGMEEEESEGILNLLYRKIHTQEYQYRHRWKPNMIVLWDNRLVQHSAVHDYYPQRRLMERVTIKGPKVLYADEPADIDEVRRYLMPPITAFEGVREKRQHEL